MPYGYVIAQISIKDPQAYAEYVNMVQPTLDAFYGEFLVRGSVAIALKLRISKVIIGLTLVAFATSAPELIVSIIAAMKGKSAIALGNVIGSNVANIGLILGLTALLYKMQAVRLTYRNDWLFLLGANGLLGVFLYFGGISFIQGLILVAALVVYNTLKIRSARKERAAASIGQDVDVPAMPIWQGVLLLIIGAVGLKFGARLFVTGIATIAAQWGWSESNKPFSICCSHNRSRAVDGCMKKKFKYI